MVNRKKLEPVICQLSKDSVEELLAIELDAEPNPWKRNMILKAVSESLNLTYGARCQGALQGFLICQVVEEEAHILKLAVKSSYRRRGFGRALLVELLSDLHSAAVSRVGLEVRESNRAALNLYQAFGFREVALRESYYSDNNEDAIYMNLGLIDFAAQNPALVRRRAL